MAPKKEVAAARAAAVEAAAQRVVAVETNPEEPTLEKKVSDLQTATRDAVERLDVVDERLDELENKGDRIQEEIQGLLDETVDRMDQQDHSLKDEIDSLKKVVRELAQQSEVVALKGEIEELKAELLVYKAAVQSGMATTKPSRPRPDVAKPKVFSGKRSAQEIENFMWGLEKYFKGMGIEEDVEKAGFDNDPSAGSPTETLLRLLLPLNDKVQWTSRDVAGSEPPTSPRSEHFTGPFNRAGGTTRPIKARSASPAVGTSRPVLTVRRTGRPTPRSNYELFNCNNLNIRYWSWNYRGCWHQTCPPMDPR
ncbi:hypothetical protein V6N13_073685 [Hibiscus sabdariffa]